MEKKTRTTSQKPASEPILYDRKGAAAVMGISIRSLDYLIADKRIRTVRKGKKVMILRSEVARWAGSNDYKPLTPRKKPKLEAKPKPTDAIEITIPGITFGAMPPRQTAIPCR